MGRKVKCQDTGLYSESDIAYKAPNGKYYTNESAWILIDTNKKYRQHCIDKMYEVLGYSEKMIIPTFFYKKLKELEVYGYDVVLNTIIAQEKSIEWALNNKDFKQETAKIMYIMAIISNNVMDEYKKKIAEEKQQKSLKNIQYSSDITDFNTDLNIERKQKSKDISRFLDEDE